MTADQSGVISLLVIVPTRGRPQNISRLIDAWAETSAGVAQLLVAVDDDDPAKLDYLSVVLPTGFAWLEAAPRPDGGGMGPVLNRYATRYAGSYRALGFLGDDHVPRSGGWDRLIVKALSELGTGIVYGDDLFQRQNLPTAVFMTADIVRTLGWMSPPELRHLWIDNAWMDLGRAAGCLRYLPDVVIEHVHPAAAKAAMDDGYRRVNSPTQNTEDFAAYRAWCQGPGPQAAARIRALAEAARG